MSLTELITYTAALSVAVATPGPGIAAVVGRALGSGLRGALPMIPGLVMGDFCYLIAAAFGMTAVARSFGDVFVVVRYAGAAYLLYMAYKMWTKPTTAEVIAERTKDSALRTFLSTFLLTIGNPKVIVFYLALLPTIIDLSSMTVRDFIPIALVTLVVLLVVPLAYALAASKARALFRSPGAVKAIDRTAGAVMAGAAVYAVVRS